jgi:hypothetical protein
MGTSCAGNQIDIDVWPQHLKTMALAKPVPTEITSFSSPGSRDQWISSDNSLSGSCPCKLGNVSRHLEQYLSLDCTRRRKLHPQNSQYLASRIIAPTGTLWVSYSCSPCQGAGGLIRPGTIEVRGRSLITFRGSQVYSFSMPERCEMWPSALAFTACHPLTVKSRYGFGFDRSRNEFKNSEKFCGRGVPFGANACSAYSRRPTK